MVLEFTVYGVALPKGNMRAFTLKGMKHPVITESNRNVKSWQQLIAEGASHAINALPYEQRTVLTSGVRLTVVFYLPRPKYLQKRGKPVVHVTIPDLDKLVRAVGDALQAVAFLDDKQIVECIAVKRYVDVGGVPRADIRVEPTAGTSSTKQIELLEVTRVGSYHEQHIGGLAK